MENTFENMISIQAQPKVAEMVNEHKDEIGKMVVKKIMPTILTVGLAAQAGPVFIDEAELRSKSFAKILKDEMEGKREPAPEPERIPGMVVALTIGTTAIASGDQVVTALPWNHTLVQIPSQEEKNIGYQGNFNNQTYFYTRK